MTRGSVGGMLRPSKMAPTIWQTIDTKYQTRCEKCGKKIYKYWKRREPNENFDQEMSLCGNCCFGRK